MFGPETSGGVEGCTIEAGPLYTLKLQSPSALVVSMIRLTLILEARVDCLFPDLVKVKIKQG